MSKNDDNAFPIAVLISGRGSNLISLHQAIKKGETQGHIACVVSSSPEAKGLQYAQEQGIPTLVIPKDAMRSEESFAGVLLACFRQYEIKLVVLAGFLKKIPARVVTAYQNRMINVHPALLPSFGGKGMYGQKVHAAVIEYGCKVSGATVHIVTNEYDAGPPVIQQCVQVHHDDTPETLAQKVLKIEHEILPKAVDLFARGLVEVEGRRVKILGADEN